MRREISSGGKVLLHSIQEAVLLSFPCYASICLNRVHTVKCFKCFPFENNWRFKINFIYMVTKFCKGNSQILTVTYRVPLKQCYAVEDKYHGQYLQFAIKYCNILWIALHSGNDALQIQSTTIFLEETCCIYRTNRFPMIHFRCSVTYLQTLLRQTLIRA